MSTAMQVSIIIDNYNYARFLRESIDSAINQTWRETEVIVVDDGSTDSSPEIIASYGNRVTPVLKKNGGQNSALNAGFAVSRGEVVIFLDSDDTLFPTAAEAAVRALREPGAAKAYWPLGEWDALSKPTGKVWGHFPGADLRDQVRQEGPDAASCLGLQPYTRKFLETVFPLPEMGGGGPKPLNCEAAWVARPGPDVYLSTLAALYGRIEWVPEPQACYRMHGQNGYQSLQFEDRLKYDMALFDYVSEAAAEYCARLRIDVDREQWKARSWAYRVQQAVCDIVRLVPAGASFILVDEANWKTDPSLAGRKRIPFLEHEGQYWGCPADDATAIAELERLRERGADFMVFTWQAFWWLDYYSGLRRRLRGEFHCELENDRVVIFDLRKEGISG